jgi:hypothetical protein
MQDGISNPETRARTDAPRQCAAVAPVAPPRRSGIVRSHKELP